MARTYEFSVGAAEAGLRLDHYLTRHLPTMVSRTMIQRGILEGTVTVGGRPVKVHYKLRSRDVIVAQFDHLPARGGDVSLSPQPIPLEIMYEDAELLVVNKPAGLVTHPAPGHWDGTLVNAILWHLGQGTRDKGQGQTHLSRGSRPVSQLSRAGIVHRLDKDTSGLLLVAKTASAHTLLSKQLKARLIHRRYLAIAEGQLPLNEGTMNAPIGRHLTHRKEMTVRHLGGRTAVTHYRILKRMEMGQGAGDEERGKASSLTPHTPHPTPLFAYTVLEVSLDTGRTHQIRVHMAHFGYPIVGDTTYGRHPTSFWQAFGVNRHLLHAYRLRFQHPTTRRTLSLTAPIPADMTRWIDAEVLKSLEGL